MPIEINNTKTTLIAGNYTFITSVDSVVGMIVRVFNTGSTTQTYTYTDPYNAPVTVSVPASGSAGNPLYVLAASSSAADSFNGVTGIVAIRLLITGSSVGSAFTESVITTTGAGNWTKPAGVTEVIVECWGGGGAGGGATVTDFGGGGGAGGQYARKFIGYLSPQQSISYVVGSGGTGGTGTGPSGSSTTWNSTQVIAVGGAGGQFGDPLGGFGGVGSTVGGVGDVVYAGGNGASQSPLAFGGPGGSGAGSSQNGNPANGEGPIEGGPAALEYGGNGAEETAVSGNGQPGNNYGGGASGALKLSGANRTGGDGAQGLIRLIYR